MLADRHATSVSIFRGVLLGATDDDAMNKVGHEWRVSDGVTTIPCLVPSTDILDSLLSSPVATTWFRILTWYAEGNILSDPVTVVVEAKTDVDDNDALMQIPPSICPRDGVYASTISLISSITTAPLRDFMEDVLLNRDVCKHYWTMPASARHHHAFAGGLAEHSLEVATDLSRQSQLDAHERDICIAAGLLHDVGKVWSYTSDMFLNTAARAMGHEIIGLSRLEHDVARLERSWPDGAYAMRVLLSGCSRVRADGQLTTSLSARLRAADQRSCERDMTRKDARRSWRPLRCPHLQASDSISNAELPKGERP